MNRVRVQAKLRHLRFKRNEAAIIIQRNLAPKARAYNLARLTMVTLRQYNRIAEEVVDFITDFLLEGGIQSVADVFARQISDKFEVVYPKVEERVFDNLIDEAVLVEMHIWLEEQLLAILAENQRISEERMRLEAELGLTDGSTGECAISWGNVPLDFYAQSLDCMDSPQQETIHALQNMIINSASVSAPESRVASASGSRVGTPPSNVSSNKHVLIPPSVHNRAHFINLRGSISASSASTHGLNRGSGSISLGIASTSASFSMSPQHYRNVLMRLSSVDMNHSVKYEAALIAANLAASSSGSFDAGSPSQPPIGQLHSLSESNDRTGSQDDEEEEADMSNRTGVRFIDNDVSIGPTGADAVRVNEMLPQVVAVEGIAECDEEEEEELGGEIVPTEASERLFHDFGGKDQSFLEESDSAAQNNESSVPADASDDAPGVPDDVASFVSDADSSTMLLVRQRTTSDFAEAFASMSITSVLNQFGDSLVMGTGGADDATAGEEVSTIPGVSMSGEQRGEAEPPSEEAADNQWTSSEPVSGDFYVDSEVGDAASDIGSGYYELSVAGSLATTQEGGTPPRHVEEWEVCRDFTSMSLTEQEKREIDQLFKDAMHYFHKARYQRASDVLENFLPILSKFPSSDPFHPDVARVQTTIKTIKARILFEQAQYADAKEVFDDALQHRIEVFGKAHYLCVELYYFIGEWHRTQAQYDSAEKYLHQVRYLIFFKVIIAFIL